MNFSHRLRTSGLKATRPRQRVLEAFECLGGHHSVDEIVAWLHQQGDRIPRGSVYGVVEALADKGLLQRADAGPGKALYELSGAEHHHFVCQNCGEIFDVDLPQGFPWPQFSCAASITQAQIVFRGVCAACASGPSTSILERICP